MINKIKKNLICLFILILFFPLLCLAQGNLSLTINEQPTVTEGVITSPDTGGASSSGGGSATTLTIPKTLNIPITIKTTKFEKISIFNDQKGSINVKIQVIGLENILIIEDKSFTLGPGENKEVTVKIIALGNAGIQTGKIIINGQVILVSIDVSTDRTLLSADLDIFSNEMDIEENLKVQFSLNQIGKERAENISINYIIKDFEGRVFLEENETISIKGQKSFIKEFSTQNLLPGDYIIGIEIIYEREIVTSSSFFKIKQAELPALMSPKFLIFLLVGVLLLFLGLITYLILRKPKLKKPKKAKK